MAYFMLFFITNHEQFLLSLDVLHHYLGISAPIVVINHENDNTLGSTLSVVVVANIESMDKA